MNKEYFPQVYDLPGAILVKDINDPCKTFTIFKDPEIKTWYDSMNKASWLMEQKENPPEDFLPSIRAICENNKRRAEFELVFYGYVINENVLYFL